MDIDHRSIRRMLTDAKNSGFIINMLSKLIGEKTAVKVEAELGSRPLDLLEIDGFFWRRECWDELDKTVFNITPCFNDFERHFARFLDYAKDINRFVKLAETFTRFFIRYVNSKGAIAPYYPDFIAEQKNGNGKIKMWIIETKGWEKEDVFLKDKFAEEWCLHTSRLSGVGWEYLKITYLVYMSMTGQLTKFASDTFDDFLHLYNKHKTEQSAQTNS